MGEQQIKNNTALKNSDRMETELLNREQARSHKWRTLTAGPSGVRLSRTHRAVTSVGKTRHQESKCVMTSVNKCARASYFGVHWLLYISATNVTKDALCVLVSHYVGIHWLIFIQRTLQRTHLVLSYTSYVRVHWLYISTTVVTTDASCVLVYLVC
jgi:hypothetical protein